MRICLKANSHNVLTPSCTALGVQTPLYCDRILYSNEVQTPLYCDRILYSIGCANPAILRGVAVQQREANPAILRSRAVQKRIAIHACFAMQYNRGESQRSGRGFQLL